MLHLLPYIPNNWKELYESLDLALNLSDRQTWSEATNCNFNQHINITLNKWVMVFSMKINYENSKLQIGMSWRYRYYSSTKKVWDH